MIFKKNRTAVLSLLLVVSLVFGSVPQAKGQWVSQLFISEPYGGVYGSVLTAPSQVVSEFGASGRAQEVGAVSENLMSNGAPVVFPNPPSLAAPDTTSIAEKVYVGVSYSNNKLFNLSIPQTMEGSTFYEPVTIDCTQPQIIIGYSGNYLVPYMPSTCGIPTVLESLGSMSYNPTYNFYWGSNLTFGRNNYPTLFDYTRTTQVKYINPQTVSVNVGTSGFSENFSISYNRTFVNVWVYSGDRTSYVCNTWNSETGQWGPDPNCEAVYLNGQTYVAYAYIPWTATNVSNNGTAGLAPTSSSVLRPLNSDIIYLSPTKCRQTSDSGFWRDTTTVDCVTYGLSADGRVGTARYHDSQSTNGFGMILLQIGISFLAGQLLPVGGFGGVLFSDVGNVVTALRTAYQITTLTDPLIQAASGPSVYGTVENSNNLGVGGWLWRGGFNTANLPVLTPPPNVPRSPLLPPPPPPPICSFSASPSSIIPPQTTSLLWNCTNANSCSVNQGLGSVGTSDSRTVSPKETTTYTLSCSGTGGTADYQTTVTVKKTSIKEIAP